MITAKAAGITATLYLLHQQRWPAVQDNTSYGDVTQYECLIQQLFGYAFTLSQGRNIFREMDCSRLI